jgi:hypothetical protein
MISHYFDKKRRNQEDLLQLLEYIALLISFDPKNAHKAIMKRRQRVAQEEKKKDKNFFKIDSSGKNSSGDFINTTFLDSIKEFGGEQAVKDLEGENYQEIEKEEKQIYQTGFEDDDEFLNKAKEMFIEREKELREEEEFRKNNPELFKDQEGTIIF